MDTFFSAEQQDIMDHIFQTGIFTTRQVALLLPRLVEFTLAHNEGIAGELTLQYGRDRAEILEKLGADLLEGRQAAKELFENMISKTKKSH